MKWSWKIGTFAGVDLYIHWTFLILIGWILYVYAMAGRSVWAALAGVAFVLAIFACIVLHEMGHALAARRYGVQTKDITLLPIGGMARLQRIPEHPLQELVVALAGPLVNVIIAAMLAVILLPVVGTSGMAPGELLTGKFLQNMLWVNVALVLFNMLPAFPMDGGRVLRALLATQIDYTQATNIAAGIGQMMAILFAVVGLFYNPFLLFIALFVYLGAEAEARLVQIRSLLRGVPVRDAMIRRFVSLAPLDRLETAADELLAGTQQDFPVEERGVFRGLLRRTDLAEALKERGPEAFVSDVMQTHCPQAAESDMLETVMEQMRDEECPVCPVLRNGQLVGLITLENIGELMMIRSAKRKDEKIHRQDLVESS